MAGVLIADFDSERSIKIMQRNRYRQVGVFVQCAEAGEDVKAELLWRHEHSAVHLNMATMTHNNWKGPAAVTRDNSAHCSCLYFCPLRGGGTHNRARRMTCCCQVFCAS